MNHRLAGLLAISFASVVWGTTGTAATFAVGAGPLAIGACALGLGGLLQALIAVPALRRSWSDLRRSRVTVLVGATAVAVYPLAFYSAMHFAGVAVGSVISLASAPLASGLLERVVDKSRLSRWWIVAAAVGVLGSVLLCAAKLGEESEPSPHAVLGIALGLVAGATYAAYSWAARRLMDRGIGRAASMGAVFGGGGMLLMPVLFLAGHELLRSPQNVAVGVYMALVPMFLGYLAFGYGLARVTASTATTLTLSEPAIATALAVVIVGERLSPLGWIGMGCIGAVLLLLALAPSDSTSRKEPALEPLHDAPV